MIVGDASHALLQPPMARRAAGLGVVGSTLDAEVTAGCPASDVSRAESALRAFDMQELSVVEAANSPAHLHRGD